MKAEQKLVDKENAARTAIQDKVLSRGWTPGGLAEEELQKV